MRAIVLVSLACCLLSACSACDETTIDGCTAGLDVDRRAIDFGRVYIGSAAIETLQLTSPGCAGVEYAAHFELDAFGFLITPAQERIGANAAREITAIFRPGRVGPIHGRVVFVADNTESSSVAVELFANGAAIPDCEDGNGCTLDEFNLETGECEHRAERLVCDDFNACTGSDLCVEGVCLGESFSCDDRDVCTDDLCDPLAGCLNMLTAACSDGNPCTLDSCDPISGCQHMTLDDGTPCNDLEQCTIGDICLRGECIGVNVTEGIPCDDNDPCSKNDQCIEGTCLDPTYHRASVGELKFTTEVGALADGAELNPLIDRDGTVFVGIEGGVTAIDLCGEVMWTNAGLGTPRWSGAISLPGILSVPVGDRIFDVETNDGVALRELDTRVLYRAETSSAGVRVLDMAVRASGGLVISVIRETQLSTASEEIERQGYLAEVDPLHVAVLPLSALGHRHASRLAVDADEGVVAILRDGAPDKGIADERLARFGLRNLPETTWASTPIAARRSDLAFGPGEEILWTDGLVAVDRLGALRTVIDRDPAIDAVETGSPVTYMNRAIVVEHNPAIGLLWGGFGGDHLVSIDLDTGEVVYRVELSGRARTMTPAIDLQGTAYVVTHEGVMHAIDREGRPIFDAALPVFGEALEHVALGITPEGVVVGVAEGRVFGVQSVAPLSNSSWPRNRRDNLGTGHR